MIYESGLSVPSSQYQDRWSPHSDDRSSDVFTGKWTGKRPAVTHYPPTNETIKCNDVEKYQTVILKQRWFVCCTAMCSLCSWFYISHPFCNYFHSFVNTRFFLWIWPIFIVAHSFIKSSKIASTWLTGSPSSAVIKYCSWCCVSNTSVGRRRK